jgi:NADH dehydrogenase (ubiquinone) Fe-S protein 3
MLKNIYLKWLGVSAKTITLYSRVILEYIKEHTLTNFRQLVDIVTYDVPGKGLRFSSNYLMLSLSQNLRFVLNSKTDEVTSILTATDVFASAD